MRKDLRRLLPPAKIPEEAAVLPKNSLWQSTLTDEFIFVGKFIKDFWLAVVNLPLNKKK